jgi:hypothetical protein
LELSKTPVKLRKKGLKKQSKLSLAEFVKEFTRQSEEERRNFIKLIYNVAKQANDYTTYIPQDLDTNVILPEIREWIKMEPNNPIPYRLSGDINDNKKAVLLDPYDQEAIKKYAGRIIGKISMNQHEIDSGYGYDGSPAEDIEAINFLEAIVINVDNFEEKEKLIQELSSLKKSAVAYLIN